jgi:hypothetical protein
MIQEQKERLLGFYRMMKRLGKVISFNRMMNSKNKSRKEVYDWFVNLTGDEFVTLGEGGIVDAYDEDGITNSLITKKEHFEYRRTASRISFHLEVKLDLHYLLAKTQEFTKSILSQSRFKISRTKMWYG